MLNIHEKEILFGKIRITEQDGGYHSPAVEIGLTDLTNFIEGLAEKRFTDIKEYCEHMTLPGEYRIIIERIE